MFDLQSGKSMNISAGKVGRRVSRELEKKLTTHPATMFAAELYLKNKKSNTPMPNRLEISGQLDNTSLRARARSEMLVRINEELIRLNKKTTKVVQIVKMLRPEGYQGVRLEGFGFTAKQYTSLSSNQCIRLLNNLKIPGKVRLVLVKPSSDKDEEETADEDGDINEEDENEDNDTEDGGNEDSDGILNGDDDDGDNGDNGDDGDEECGNNRDNNANDNDGDTSQSVNQINSAIETY
ncbi:hypothetical protein BCR33DRAFT_78685 [Rhizoclosmatium globosum]|uniref:Uncharacterized protein n=1 Tax=Rhizoclosmatium globosum TaxID=329046 RepID=A0A1Y2CN47_9FUNG|nr:hypothetical protein BCR33DRAFT_78685 [Rhizoclosmatium globosum]|eukprot:ORY47765.1 hypothetical protein BCR33DRAFT_78685 [Rhizoclosmatium globosum]